jgi:hypothetical protein
MTLQEAMHLAAQIEASNQWTVIAIGRFKLQEELQQAHRGGYIEKLPWAISMMAIDDVNDRTRIQNAGEWDEYLKGAMATRSRLPQLDKKKSMEGPSSNQLSLFQD